MKPLVGYAEKQDRADAARVAKYAKQKAAKVKVNYVTSGGRHSDPDKLAWMRTQRCLVMENRRWKRAPGSTPDTFSVVPKQTPCFGLIEPHHHRVRGARANDAKTVPLCSWHHQKAPDSLHTLGRRGFQGFHQLDLDAECLRKEAEWTAQKSGTPSPGVK